MKKINYAFLAVLAVCANLDAGAQDNSNTVTERWQCFSEQDYLKNEALVELTRSLLTGVVSVAGTSHIAYFTVAGFDRRWDFGPDGDSWKYAFIIEPGGSGMYYDFSMSNDGRAKPRQFFNCVQR